jgi:hypothetical protein
MALKPKKILHEIRLDEVSHVDRGANPYAKVLMIKRDTPLTPASAYDALMVQARELTNRVAKSATGRPMTVETAFASAFSDPANAELANLAKRHYVAPVETGAGTPAAPTNKSYDKLLAMAKRLSDAEGCSEAQAFARVADSNPELFAKAKRPAKQGTPNPSFVDGGADDPDEADTDPEPDDDDHDIGPPDDTSAATPNTGRSPSRYLSSGANMNQMPRDAAIGPAPRSYNPTARPRSALKKVDCAAERGSLSSRAAQRYDRFLKRSPQGTHNDAMWYARASKEQRRAYKAARKAG